MTYEGPMVDDVLAVFQTLLLEYGFIHGITAEELTDLFCEELLKWHAGHVMDQISWGYQ
jgi:hypothetical protein